MRKFAGWKIANGEDIDIVHDRWVGDGGMVNLRINHGVTRVSDLMEASRRGWDVTKIRELFSGQDAIRIIQTPVCWTATKDVLFWPKARSGEYSIKSCYYALKKEEDQARRDAALPSSSAGISREIWKIVWETNVPQKIKIFMWKACNNILPVKDNLRRRRLSRDSVCPVCGVCDESVEHALLFCNWTKPVWFGSQLQSVPDEGGIPSLPEWLNQVDIRFQNLKDFRRFILSVIFCVLWSIWKARNKLIFEHTPPNPVATLIEANNLINEVQNLSIQQATPPTIESGGEGHWRPPPIGVIKINTDASFSSNSKIGYAGIIGRDEKGELVMGLTKKFPVNSALLAEALALREAIQAAANFSIPKVILESDCLPLIRACRKEIKIGEISMVVQDIIFLRREFQSCGFTWTHRSKNEAAHTVAKLHKLNRIQGNWIAFMPAQLRTIIDKDRAEIFSARQGDWTG